MSGENLPSAVSLADAIRDRVRKTMFDAIPDGAIDAMVTKEYELFFSKKDSYGHNKQSEFEQVVRKEIGLAMQETLKATVQELMAQQYNSETEKYEFVTKAVQELGPLIWAQIQAQMIQTAMGNIQSHLSSVQIYR